MTSTVPARLSVRGWVIAVAVSAAAGLMFAVSSSLARAEGPLRQPTDLVAMVREEQANLEALTQVVDELRAEVDDLTLGAPLPFQEDAARAQLEGRVVGTLPVQGGGLRIELDDAPDHSIAIPGVSPDDLIVHQQDLEHVINALWAGGAEALTLQGRRVIGTTGFRCSGNILLIQGQVYSPPYVIEVIGDPARLLTSLEASPGVNQFQRAASVFGLGWSVSAVDRLVMPAYTGATEMNLAELPEGVDPLR
ncbi:MAG: DUF881 domain-containing protein [Promicromonosporaceae bacterium]|nr:DUF881 domain-containing protein [Promicromonosporaceae bacterium]